MRARALLPAAATAAAEAGPARAAAGCSTAVHVWKHSSEASSISSAYEGGEEDEEDDDDEEEPPSPKARFSMRERRLCSAVEMRTIFSA